jgi:surface antigen
MEMFFGDDMSPKGHVSYVEAVFPDKSIQVSEANWPEDGIYNERVMVEEEWRALAPHFIVVS